MGLVNSVFGERIAFWVRDVDLLNFFCCLETCFSKLELGRQVVIWMVSVRVCLGRGPGLGHRLGLGLGFRLGVGGRGPGLGLGLRARCRGRGPGLGLRPGAGAGRPIGLEQGPRGTALVTLLDLWPGLGARGHNQGPRQACIFENVSSLAIF